MDSRRVCCALGEPRAAKTDPGGSNIPRCPPSPSCSGKDGHPLFWPLGRWLTWGGGLLLPCAAARRKEDPVGGTVQLPCPGHSSWAPCLHSGEDQIAPTQHWQQIGPALKCLMNFSSTAPSALLSQPIRKGRFAGGSSIIQQAQAAMRSGRAGESLSLNQRERNRLGRETSLGWAGLVRGKETGLGRPRALAAQEGLESPAQGRTFAGG